MTDLQPAAFLTASLLSHPHGQAVTRILEAAMRAVAPGGLPHPGLESALAGTDHGQVVLLGLGKASAAMSLPVASMLTDAGLAWRGLLIPKQVPLHFPNGFEVLPGGHPVPDARSLRAGLRALELAGSLGEDDLLICLLSGGGSALMTAPQPGLSLEDLRVLTAALLGCGARIDEINCLRRHLDQVKGGGLARAAYPARVLSFILSDVVANPLEAIASGPTAPDPSSKDQALGIIDTYNLRGKIPGAVLRALESAPETPKPGNTLFARVENYIVGSNSLAAQAALSQAQNEGLRSVFLGDDWQGEARDVARTLCARLKEQAAAGRPVCLVAGGETTVTLGSQVGRGGRNQELALAAVDELAGLDHLMLVSLATDGEDGPTDAAGALVTGATYSRALAQGLHAADHLQVHNAYAFFDALGDLLKIGPSGTNVNDLTFLFAF